MHRNAIRTPKAAHLAGIDIGPFGRYEGGEVYGLFCMIDGDDNAVDYVISKAGAEMIIQSAQAFIDIVDGKRPMPDKDQLS